ncbi:MAG: flagellar export protein FliJ [Candidatus Margulisiibacteriota bacterium]|nr:MAG: flagellar export protein FliJ [Candidatus Margulisbacteria bacterium GWD2_39_127]OGI05190.1 MAG: flagellar export protein FliJ [Candidatus Margulisbacteria bacterium GWF2_38_17]OGI06239.1 MAG: flagellar export protein FliJ [Candidatus Margulisbacteria bacterium GWE2_39_32]PZM78896.1 MAG: flagellar export protein FliJ [Candidatus Margulisiibacteriota bacterium]HAR64522.1 flagellar export protein FliJ [Candidatus Margulisiibacteriota bacterium]
MKKFKFKLQKLLDLKIRKEDFVKEQFAKAVRKLETEKDFLIQASSELSEERQQQKARRLQQRISSDQELQYQCFFKKLQNKIAATQIKVNQAANVVNQKRAELIQARKDRRIIEELKEKQINEYLLMVDKEENKVLDEIATMAAARENEFVMKGI